MEQKHQIILALLLPLTVAICGHPAYAMDWSETSQATLSIFQFTTHIVAAGILCIGVAFFGNACLKLKYHRDNPIQTPLSATVTMFVLATVMLVFATFIMVSQKYVYNTDKDMSITKAFHSNLNPRQATPNANIPTANNQVFAQQEEHIDMDEPYL